MYKLIENDVRLMRRILVAYNLNDYESAWKVTKYLRDKGCYFLLPKEQTEEVYRAYRARLPQNEKWLADKYGAIILPNENDIIFLNSKWINPYTLYVRLVEEVPELGELGQIHWVAFGTPTDFRPRAEYMHSYYVAHPLDSSGVSHSWLGTEEPPEKPVEEEPEPVPMSFWDRLKGYFYAKIQRR